MTQVKIVRKVNNRKVLINLKLNTNSNRIREINEIL